MQPFSKRHSIMFDQFMMLCQLCEFSEAMCLIWDNVYRSDVDGLEEQKYIVDVAINMTSAKWSHFAYKIKQEFRNILWRELNSWEDPQSL